MLPELLAEDALKLGEADDDPVAPPARTADVGVPILDEVVAVELEKDVELGLIETDELVVVAELDPKELVELDKLADVELEVELDEAVLGSIELVADINVVLVDDELVPIAELVDKEVEDVGPILDVLLACAIEVLDVLVMELEPGIEI